MIQSSILDIKSLLNSLNPISSSVLVFFAINLACLLLLSGEVIIDLISVSGEIKLIGNDNLLIFHLL